VKTLLVLLILSMPAFAADVQITWDPMPVAESPPWQTIRIYEVTSGTYVQVGEVQGLATSFLHTGVPDTRHSYVIRAVVDNVESDDSNVASTKPRSPTGAKAKKVQPPTGQPQ
jgi:hypothetical protein